MRPFSVVIPSGGAAAGLRQTLASIAEQPGDLVEEVIVVRDRAAAEPDLLEPGSRARVLTTGSPRGPAAARNVGAAHAAAPTLVFLDDDVVLAPGALARVQECFERTPSGTAFVGTILPHPSVADNAYVRFAYGGAAHAPAGDSTAPIAPWLFCTSLCALLAEDFSRAGGFDESFGPGSAYEDVELGARLAALGTTLRSCGAAVGLHLRQMDRAWFMARLERLGEPLERLLSLHPGLRLDPQSGTTAGPLATRLSRSLWPGLLRLLPLVERIPPRAGGAAVRLIHAVGVAAGLRRGENSRGRPSCTATGHRGSGLTHYQIP